MHGTTNRLIQHPFSPPRVPSCMRSWESRKGILPCTSRHLDVFYVLPSRCACIWLERPREWGGSHMAIDPAVFLLSRGKETSHWLCGVQKAKYPCSRCNSEASTHGDPCWSLHGSKGEFLEVDSSPSGVLIPTHPTCRCRDSGGPVLQGCVGNRSWRLSLDPVHVVLLETPSSFY